MDFIQGEDGEYIVKDGKLVKVVTQYFSDGWGVDTSGYSIITLEDGSQYKISD